MEEKVEEIKEKKKKKSILKGGKQINDGDPSSTKKSSKDGVELSTFEAKSNESIQAQRNVDILPEKSKKSNGREMESLKDDKDKSAIDIINEIFNPPLMEFDTTKPYQVPKAVEAGDVNALQDLDERKIIELKEAFLLFDLDGDGFIDADDLRATFRSLGDESVPETQIEQMLSEAMNPLDFDAFVMLLGYKTIELDPEDVLIEALSKWDLAQTGVISEEKIRHDLISYGDRFTEKEASYALEEAPITNQNRAPGDPILIDYQKFCRILGGLRKRKMA